MKAVTRQKLTGFYWPTVCKQNSMHLMLRKCGMWRCKSWCEQ